MTSTNPVDRIVRAMKEAWNAGDAVAYGELFAPDVTFIDVTGRQQHGRDTVISEHQKIFQTIYRRSVWSGVIDSVDDIGSVQVVTILATISVPEGPRKGTTPAIQTLIFENGLIRRFHNTLRTRLADFAKHDAALAGTSPLEWDSETS